jgi:hypothetical protein
MKVAQPFTSFPKPDSMHIPYGEDLVLTEMSTTQYKPYYQPRTISGWLAPKMKEQWSIVSWSAALQNIKYLFQMESEIKELKLSLQDVNKNASS